MTPLLDEHSARDEELASAFRAIGTDQAFRPHPVVIVKRRRVTASADARDSLAEEGPAARTPKVHRLRRAATPDGDLGPGRSGTAAYAPSELPEVPVRRPRRRLHGEVRVLPVPVRQEPQPSAEAAAVVQYKDLSMKPNHFMGPAAWRYERLQARIAELSAKAERLKQSGRSATLAWARQAIVDFEITARDLGLKVGR